jgi:tRNA A-37 threonylcarbamoyl transferase component Bud32
MAAASLGQVYRARLANGHWVAVKVQRPELPFILRRDMAIIRTLGLLVAPFLPLNLGFGLGGIIDEFGRSLFEEIDYRMEADNAERFARMFAQQPEVTVPAVERALSSRRVLTTTWINGTKLIHRKELEAHHLDPAALIRTGVIAGLRQLLEFGYFHADPHPGNLFALPGKTAGMGHVAYVDFGMMDSISDADRLTLTGAVVHLINRDFEALAQDFPALGFLNPRSDLPADRAGPGGSAGGCPGRERRLVQLQGDHGSLLGADVRLSLPGTGPFRPDHPGGGQPGGSGPAPGSRLPHHPCGLSLCCQAVAGGGHRRNAGEAAGGDLRSGWTTAD